MWYEMSEEAITPSAFVEGIGAARRSGTFAARQRGSSALRRPCTCTGSASRLKKGDRWGWNSSLSESEGWNECEWDGGEGSGGDVWGRKSTRSNGQFLAGSARWRPTRRARVRMNHERQGPQQQAGTSREALAVGPLQVASVVIRAGVHGELDQRMYCRSRGRSGALKPLVRANLVSPFMPVQSTSFEPRVVDKESLYVGTGITRGAAVTSEGTALRHKQIQFRHWMHQTTHKPGGLARLAPVFAEQPQRQGSTVGAGKND